MLTNAILAGSVRYLKKTRDEAPRTWADLGILSFTPDSKRTAPDALWHSCKYVVSRHGDRCPVDSWVFASTKVRLSALIIVLTCSRSTVFQDTMVIGRIEHICTPAPGQEPQDDYVVIKQYTVPTTPHPRLHMPELHRSATESSHTLVLATVRP